jgi:hypothetical protein
MAVYSAVRAFIAVTAIAMSGGVLAHNREPASVTANAVDRPCGVGCTIKAAHPRTSGIGRGSQGKGNPATPDGSIDAIGHPHATQ